MSWDQNLRLRHIRCFLEVARLESVSKAAETLHLTQPAVSRSIKELEGILDARLFDRVGRGLRLNEAGRVFQAHGSSAMIQLLKGRNRISKEGYESKRLSVGVLPTAATDLLPRALLSFSTIAPHVRTHVLTGPNWLLFNQLRDGSLDLVVGRMPENEAKTQISFEQLYLERVVLVCRTGHPILSESEPESLIGNYPLILPPGGAVISSTVERYLTSIGLPDYRTAVETVALPIGRKLVLLSDALWFISHGVIVDELSSGTLQIVEISSPLLAGPVGFTVARSAPLSVERTQLIDCLRTAAKKAPVETTFG